MLRIICFWVMRINFIDFIIKIDKPINEFSLEEQRALSENILQRILLNRIKKNKPTVVLLVADSGEGKSYTALKICDIILKAQGIDFAKHLNDVVVYTPLEYARKIDNLLNNKELKKVNVIMIDEARELVKASTWYSFVNRAIADVNAMSRGIKPMVFIVVTQFIKDIDPATRRTLTFYGKCARPHRRVKLWLYKLWKDDRDIERPELRKRRIYGVIKRGNRKAVIKPTFNFSMPRKELVEPYEIMQRQQKGRLIRRKLELLIKNLEKEFKGIYNKVDAIVKWYSERPGQVKFIIERKGKKIKLTKDVQAMHDLTSDECNELEKRLMEKYEKGGFAVGVEKEAK